MKSVVAGGSGFIGQAVVAALEQRGEVVVLSRDPSRVTRGRGVQWNPPAGGEWEAELESAHAVVNLAGENIAGKPWTARRKAKLIASRVEPTAAIASAIANARQKPRVLINASGIGIYGNRGDEQLVESSPPGRGFLAELAQQWEGAAHAAAPQTRVVILRFGVVMAKEGGMLQRLLPLFRLNAGGKLGTGEQWFPWISLRDAVQLITWSIDNTAAVGVYNATAPQPVTNAEFTRELAKALGRFAWFRVPAFPLRALLGEMAEELLFSSQRALPEKALREGFEFTDPELFSALRRAVQ